MTPSPSLLARASALAFLMSVCTSAPGCGSSGAASGITGASGTSTPDASGPGTTVAPPAATTAPSGTSAGSGGGGAIGPSAATDAGAEAAKTSVGDAAPRDAGTEANTNAAADAAQAAADAAPTGGVCGSATLNPNPFGCGFAWGVDNPSAGSSFLNFGTLWIESGITASGTFTTCSGCNWVKNTIAPSNLIPVYYAYIIGFLGHANGFVDGNQCPSSNANCPNLTNQGANLIRNNRSAIIKAYGDYAQQTHAVWPTKPLVWLLEGDFIQYSGTSQSNPLTMTELGQLAADITCAIKSNMPNAVVAIDHSTWNSDQQTNDFWSAMKAANYDMVWTTGVANNNGYFATGTGPTSYNGKTATYGYVHQITGKTIVVDDGCGGNTNEDWKQGPAAVLNARIADGVIGFTHCGSLESTYQSAIVSLAPQLDSTCH